MNVKVNWTPSRKDIRSFAWVFALGFSIIGALFFWRGRPVIGGRLIAMGVAVGAVSWILPPLGRVFYCIWMSIGAVVGFVMSRVVLTVIYFAVFTPAGVWLKIRKRDALQLRKSDRSTYWLEHKTISGKDSYKHLY